VRLHLIAALRTISIRGFGQRSVRVDGSPGYHNSAAFNTNSGPEDANATDISGNLGIAGTKRPRAVSDSNEDKAVDNPDDDNSTSPLAVALGIARDYASHAMILTQQHNDAIKQRQLDLEAIRVATDDLVSCRSDLEHTQAVLTAVRSESAVQRNKDQERVDLATDELIAATNEAEAAEQKLKNVLTEAEARRQTDAETALVKAQHLFVTESTLLQTQAELKEAQVGAEALRGKISSLNAEAEEWNEKRCCGICLAAAKAVAFGCGHVFCASCAAQQSTCPLDRSPITTRIPLFL
jgi:hypothetical protein